jgi:hypothetical protein
MTDLRTTQVGAEAFVVGTPDLRITQIGAEVFYSLVPALVITQTGVEVFFDHGSIVAPPSTSRTTVCVIT